MKLRKIIFSLSILAVSLLTMVATTFAWVGIVTNTTFDEFNIKLKVDDDRGDYGVQLSLTGTPNSFSDSLDSVSVKRQLLKNLGYNKNVIDNASDNSVNATFAQQKLDQVTLQKNSIHPELFDSNELQYFENMNGQISRKFLWLDVYVSMYVATTSASSDVPLSLFLRGSILSSDDVGTTTLLNDYTYPTVPYSLGTSVFSSSFLNKKFSGKVSVNPASSARVCVQSFEPVKLYTIANTNSLRYKIYQYDDVMPTYDSYNNVYSFGGILPDEYNMSYQQYNMSHPGAELNGVPEWQVNRGDITYKDSGNIGQICDKNTDGLTVGKMMKIRVYFWFEGWDSDCFEVIDNRNVNINLSFSNKAPYDV